MNISTRYNTNTTHGATKGNKRTPEYVTWLSMRQRCADSKHKGWSRYGGRGIAVCAQWQNSFEVFLKDIGLRPSPTHSLDRINPDGNYEPQNCRWADIKTQQNNRRNNVYVCVDGKKLTVTQLAEKIGVPARTVGHRVDKYLAGLLSLERVLEPGKANEKILPTGETITQAAKRLGVCQGTISYRMQRVLVGKLSVEAALNTRQLRTAVVR